MVNKRKTKPIKQTPKQVATVDTFTAPQTAQVLGLSVKRVRQLLSEGKLKVHARNPVRIAQIEVLTLRQDREQQGKIIRPQEQKKSEVAEALAEITSVFNRQLEMVAESNRRNEENYLAQINQLKAELDRLRTKKWWQR
jgi:hypothetical protein